MRLWLVPLGAGVLATVVSSIGISDPSVWYDEAATVSAATRSLPELVALLGHVDAVHGAYYLLMHAVFDLVGYTPLSLRLVSAVAVGIAAAVVVLLDRRLRPGSHGIVAALVFAVLPRVVWMGGEGRSYALAAALAALITLVLLSAIENERRRFWVLYSVVAAAGCLLFIYVALIVVAHGVTVALLRRRMLARWSIAATAALVATTPLLILVTGQGAQLPSMPALGIGTADDVLVTQWFGAGIVLALVAWALLLVGLVRLPILAPLLVLPTAALLLAGLVNPELYQPRYLALCTPFVALALAAGLGAIPWRTVRVAGIVALVALALPQLVVEREVDAKKDGTWSAVASVVADARRTDSSAAAVVFGPLFPHHGTTARAISVAYPDAFDGLTDVTLGIPAAEYPGDLWGTWRPLASSLGRVGQAHVVYLVTTDPIDKPDSDGMVLERSGWSPARVWHEGDITVVEYRRA